MPSRVICDSGHAGGLCRPAATRLSEQGSLGSCRQPSCNAPVRYLVTQHYANLDEEHEHEVVKVIRLRTPSDVEEEGYDPMIFLLQHRETGKRVVWPFYWGRDKKGKWRVGQFPPLLGLDEMREALMKIDM